MPEFSQLLRQRLASGELVEGHPDADTLTAYAEKLLPAPEQGQVLEHLARCRDCRDVVALTFDSVPAEPQASVVITPVRSGRVGWARLIGLSASFAAVVLVAILIVRQPHSATPSQSFSQAKPSQPPAVAASNTSNDLAEKRENANPSAPPAPAELSRRASVPSAASADGMQSRISSTSTAIVDGNKGLVGGVATEAATRHDYVNDNLFIPSQNEVVAVNEIPSSPVPRISAIPLSSVYQTNNQYVANNQSSYFPDLPAQPTQTKIIQAWEPPPPSSRGAPLISAISREAKKIMRRNAPINPGALTNSAMGGRDQLNPALDKAESVEVTAAGVGVDAGNGQLDRSAAFTRRALGGNYDAGAQTTWIVGSGKLLRTDKTGAWIAGYTGPESIEFSFVSANGRDVWAGGNRAAVIHSRDGGSTWERVRLGEGATGTVLLISALGSNVRVTTSENQTWTSQDGGKTWTQN